MRICFLIRKLDHGGAERQLISLVRELPKDRYQVAVMEFYEGGTLSPELLQIHGVERICLDKRGRWDVLPFILRLVRAMRRFDPDVVHGYLYLSNVLAILLKPLLPSRTKIVMGIRSSNNSLQNYDWASALSSWAERFLSRFADLIIANSQAGFEYSQRKGFPTERMVVVHNGIDTDRFRPNSESRARVRKEWGVNDDEILIGIVARLDPKKNHRLFIDACAAFGNSDPRVRFVIVGGGGPAGYREQLVAHASSRELGERLIWAGPRQDTPLVYSALDICTLCSNAAEGFPNVVAEAMSCGVPCVATVAGDTPIIIGDTGVLVQDLVPRAVVEGWRRCLAFDLKEQGLRARERIVSNFNTRELSGRTQLAFERIASAEEMVERSYSASSHSL